MLRAQRLILGINANIANRGDLSAEQKPIVLQAMAETVNRMALERAFFAGAPVDIRMEDVTFNITVPATMEETIRNNAIGASVGTVIGNALGANPMVAGTIGVAAYGAVKLLQQECCISWLEDFFSSPPRDERNDF